MKRLAIILGILSIAGAGVWLFAVQNDSASNNTPSSTSQPKQADNEATAVATITYTNSGFEPVATTIHAGETVEIKNASAHPLQFDSDPHPAHTDNTELNVGAVTPGHSVKLTLDKKGTWGFHNHLSPEDTGKVNVQ